MYKIEDLLKLVFVNKAPKLPVKVKNMFVHISPWLVGIYSLFLLPALFIFFIIFFLLIFGMLGIVTYGRENLPLLSSFNFLLYGLAYVVFLMNIVAVPPLFKKRLMGWRLLYCASLINFVFLPLYYYSMSIFSMSEVIFLFLFCIFGIVVSSYFLYQIREYYK
jgi:hypothetical protein